MSTPQCEEGKICQMRANAYLHPIGKGTFYKSAKLINRKKVIKKLLEQIIRHFKKWGEVCSQLLKTQIKFKS